jgi:UDP-galactopyranose mutase
MPSLSDFPTVVVGSGFFGAVVAYCVAKKLNQPVLVLDRRNHVGGNSFSEIDSETEIEYHRYGSHLFHTSNAAVWKFVTGFTPFTNYRHRAMTRYAGRTFSMPINLMTINSFFGTSFDPREAAAFIEKQASAEGIARPSNLEEKAISQIGRALYEAFVKGYTMKQWETSPDRLPASIINRLPVRFNYNDFYFSDYYEGLPRDGYHAIFRKMLDDPRIRVELGCDFFDLRSQLQRDALVIYTGPLDRFYDFRFGALGWRTLDFELERPSMDDYQGTAVMNYPDPSVRFTRIHEFKHLHPERTYSPGKTLIMKEYSRFAQTQDEPYYPIGTMEDKVRFEKYSQLASAEPNVLFGGRLGTYRYLDMHQAIAAAFKCFSTRVAPRLTNGHWDGSVMAEAAEA